MKDIYWQLLLCLYLFLAWKPLLLLLLILIRNNFNKEKNNQIIGILYDN